MKTKKTSRKTLRNKADKLWSAMIRSKGFCEKCGSSWQLQAAHIFSRRFSNTRHDLENGVCLCAKCHRWAHDCPVDFAEWVAEIRPTSRLSWLAHSGFKPDYEAIILQLDKKKEEVG